MKSSDNQDFVQKNTRINKKELKKRLTHKIDSTVLNRYEKYYTESDFKTNMEHPFKNVCDELDGMSRRLMGIVEKALLDSDVSDVDRDELFVSIHRCASDLSKISSKFKNKEVVIV